MLYLPGGGAMLFLTDVDHVSFEKANETRQNNLPSATVSLQVVIGLILSILVDTFISKISLPMQPVPEIGSISVA